MRRCTPTPPYHILFLIALCLTVGTVLGMIAAVLNVLVLGLTVIGMGAVAMIYASFKIRGCEQWRRRRAATLR